MRSIDTAMITKRILAVASGGGHWEQLMLIRPAFEGNQSYFVTTLKGAGDLAALPKVYIVPDCNRDKPVKAAISALRIALLIVRLRPDVIISTGALPGVIALAIGRRMGARTIWVDSIANAEEFSMAGKKAQRHADLWISQWPIVAQEEGAKFLGSVL